MGRGGLKQTLAEGSRHEEILRVVKVMTQIKQGHWLNWEKCADLWKMEETHIQFLVGATYDVSPRPIT